MRAALVVGAGLIACNGSSSDGNADGDGDPTPGGTHEITVVTYNAGLAVGFVPGAASRTPQIAEALKDVDADVICLEEVWLPEQIAAVQAAVSANFPYTFAPAPRQSADAACEDGVIDPLLDCAATSCDFGCVDDVPTCLFAECPIQFISLPRDCMRCAMANVGEDPSTVADTCVNSPVEYAYGGSFGTMILSKHPLGPVDEHVFASTSNSRSALHTEVDVEGGPVSVFCTHLTAVFDDIPYPREGSGVAVDRWAAEQLVQIGELDTWIDEVGGENKILLGDLNTGPAVGNVAAEAPAGYDALVASGWTVPYVELDGRCTFCNDNPLIAGPDDDDGRLIDHVMLKGPIEAVSVSRILDGEISAESCAVDLTTSALSDHYGVSATLKW